MGNRNTRSGSSARPRKEIMALAAWLQHEQVMEAVMESTAQYWRPVWYGLEPHFKLHLSHPLKTRAPRGRKRDYRTPSGWRIAKGETEVEVLAAEARGVLRKKKAQLQEALAGQLDPIYRLLLRQGRGRRRFRAPNNLPHGWGAVQAAREPLSEALIVSDRLGGRAHQRHVLCRAIRPATSQGGRQRRRVGRGPSRGQSHMDAAAQWCRISREGTGTRQSGSSPQSVPATV
jgi:hypothetical protein